MIKKNSIKPFKALVTLQKYIHIECRTENIAIGNKFYTDLPIIFFTKFTYYYTITLSH